MENRRFIIFDCSEIWKIDFNETIEKTPTSLRISVDGNKTFVKYDGPKPSSLYNLTTSSQEYTYEEIINILSTEEWMRPLTP
jgi:hypothetical protein